jgi:molybdopterin-guanine dinucleotide biosynthesis protein A
MGGDKATVEVTGSTMLKRVAGAMAPVVGRVVVLGPRREGWVCWPDEVDAAGPLAGIATALSHMTEDRALVVGVDQPFLRTATLERLANVLSDLPMVPVDHRGARQVTCAVYPATIAGEAREEAVGGGSIQSLLDRVSFTPVTPDTWKSWGEDGRSWYSVDTPEALAAGLARFGDQPGFL